MLDDIDVIVRRIDPDALRDNRKPAEEILLETIRHEPRGHDYLGLHYFAAGTRLIRYTDVSVEHHLIERQRFFGDRTQPVEFTLQT